LKLFEIRALLAVFTVLSGCAGAGPSASGFPAHRHPLFHRRPTAYHRSTSIARARELVRARPTPVCTNNFRHPLLNRCRTWLKPEAESIKSSTPPKPQFDDPLGARLRIARRARGMLKTPRFSVGNTSYRRDCSGFVLAVFAKENIPIEDLLGTDRRRSSVFELYRLAKAKGRVHRNKVPDIGDLVFFDNTYDRNRDGRSNDPLTHVGIVERVDPDGTVTFVHRVRRGVLRYRLNRFKPHLRRDPDTRKVLNHYLKIGNRSTRAGSGKRLTGELFHAFATIVR
jgi:hypothetical protein